MKKSYQMEMVRGHIVLRVDTMRLLVDTGSPFSIGETDTLTFMGRSWPVQINYLGVTTRNLCDQIGTKIDVLIGIQILQHFDITFDTASGRAVFADRIPPPAGITLPFTRFAGIPVISASVYPHELCRLFFDTGAWLSYLSEAWQLWGIRLLEFPKDEPAIDFYPGVGEFETPTYRVDYQLSTETVTLRTGTQLSPAACALLDEAVVDGIIGTGLLDHFRVHLLFSRNQLVLQRLGGQ